MVCTNALLLHFDEAPGATAATDDGASGIYCPISGSVSPRAKSPERYAIKSSYYFPSGIGNHVTVNNSAGLVLSGSFTIDFSIRFDDLTTDATIFGPWTDAIAASLTLKWDESDANIVLESRDGGAALSSRYYEPTLQEDTWYHFAITRDSGNNIRLYVDGELIDGQNYGGTFESFWAQSQSYDQASGHKIGVMDAGGYIDEFSIIGGVPSPFDGEFVNDLPDVHCGTPGCIDRDAFNYNPEAHIDNGTCIPSTYWNTSDMGIVFKAHGHTAASEQADTIKIQSLQRNIWTKINFRNEYFDTSGQYFPAISTFKPTIAGRYNLKAQIQIKDALADAPSASEEHRIIVAIFKNGVNIEQNLTVVEHYYPDDPKEDTTASVETIINLTTDEILNGNNEFTAHVYIEGLEENEIDSKYCSSIGCTGAEVMFTDNFDTNTLWNTSGGNGTGTPTTGQWVVIDEPEATIAGTPFHAESAWSWDSINLRLHQANNIHGTGQETDGYGTYAYAANISVADVIFTATVVSGDNDAIGLIVRGQTSGDTVSGSYYLVEFDGGNVSNGVASINQYTQLYYVDHTDPANPTKTSIEKKSGSPYGYVPDTVNGVSFEVTFKFIGHTYEIYKDDVLHLSGTDSSKLTAGSVGLFCFGNGDWGASSFDSIQVSAITTVDDGSCTYVEGCTDPYYKEYWDNVTNAVSSVDLPNDDDCHTVAILGCTDASDANYNADANVDDGSCEGTP